MNIVVIGRGNVGGGLAKLWSQAGHDVTLLFTGNPSSAEERARCLPSAQAL